MQQGTNTFISSQAQVSLFPKCPKSNRAVKLQGWGIELNDGDVGAWFTRVPTKEGGFTPKRTNGPHTRSGAPQLHCLHMLKGPCEPMQRSAGSEERWK